LDVASNLQGKNLDQPIIIAFEFLHYHACEALTLKGSIVGSKYDLRYKLGSVGTSLCGSCQAIDAIGADEFLTLAGSKNVRGDAWVVRFLGVPRFGIDSGASTAFPVRDYTPGATQPTVSATVTLGIGFTQTVTATINSVVAKFLSTTPGDGVYKLFLDGRRFRHILQTYPLSEDDTGIMEAMRGTSPTVLQTGLSVTGYTGSCGKAITPYKGTWKGF
jgi:hypothetical protein